jgi:hypothetical protein
MKGVLFPSGIETATPLPLNRYVSGGNYVGFHFSSPLGRLLGYAGLVTTGPIPRKRCKNVQRRDGCARPPPPAISRMP